ncbi:MAG TPA: hypothetical protein VNF07_04490 [Acidimicrobiales bacterium]|nr:hypothetical protein [Acidimicrobiales bacterium]
MPDTGELTATSPAVARGSPGSERPLFGWVVLLLGLLSGLAYCSWPLGSVVNPALASSGLASDLGSHGQPYSWLFSLLDCVTGAATVLASGLLLARRRDGDRPPPVALAAYALFGLLTAVDSLLPIGCGESDLTGCGADLSRPNVDDVLTGLAVFALFVAALSALRRAAAAGPPPTLLIGGALVLAWSGTGLVFLANHFSTRPAVTLQHLFLTLSSVLSFAVPALLVAARRARSPG